MAGPRPPLRRRSGSSACEANPDKVAFDGDPVVIVYPDGHELLVQPEGVACLAEEALLRDESSGPLGRS